MCPSHGNIFMSEYYMRVLHKLEKILLKKKTTSLSLDPQIYYNLSALAFYNRVQISSLVNDLMILYINTPANQKVLKEAREIYARYLNK